MKGEDRRDVHTMGIRVYKDGDYDEQAKDCILI